MASIADTPSVTHWMRKVSEAALSFESRWTWRALRRVDEGLHQAMREQLDLFHEACVTGSRADIDDHGAATVRGYQAVTKAMIESGEADDAYFLGRDPTTGAVVAIGAQKACVARVREVAGDQVIWLTPDEVAALFAGVEAFKLIGAVKRQFPGAEIIDRFPDEPAKADGLLGEHDAQPALAVVEED